MLRSTLFSVLMICALTSIADARRSRSKHGHLKVESLTVGATIYIDGKARGTVPLKKPIRLRQGKYTIRVSHRGYADYIESFSIRRRRTTSLSIDLLEATGILSIRSRPDRAVVVLDGSILGRTPIEEEVDPGLYQLELRKEGYTTHRQPLDLKAGEPLDLDIALKPVLNPVVGVPWYQRKWVWIATAGVATVGILVALAASSDPDSPSQGFLIRVDTTD